MFSLYVVERKSGFRTMCGCGTSQSVILLVLYNHYLLIHRAAYAGAPPAYQQAPAYGMPARQGNRFAPLQRDARGRDPRR